MAALPSKKQQALLDYIDRFITENNYAPSYREIMAGLDYKSVSTVAKHVNGLIARGWLAKRDNAKRSLEVVYKKEQGAPAPQSPALVPAAGGREWLRALVAERLADTARPVNEAERAELARVLALLGLEDLAG